MRELDISASKVLRDAVDSAIHAALIEDRRKTVSEYLSHKFDATDEERFEELVAGLNESDLLMAMGKIIHGDDPVDILNFVKAGRA